MEPPLATTLRAVAEILGEYDVDSAVLGGVAANVYRDAARTTFDVDLLVSVDHERQLLTIGVRRFPKHSGCAHLRNQRGLDSRPAGHREGVPYQNRKRLRFRELRQEASCRS